MGEEYSPTVVVRAYDPNKDRERVEAVERTCEVGPSDKLSLLTDMLGDPICRVRHSPAFLMLVAEIGKEIVGMIRGCIKTVTCGKKLSRNRKQTDTANHVPVYTKVAYILGLRVSPNQRRMGIGLKLVQKMEAWFRENGVEYSYMATENDNLASVKLFATTEFFPRDIDSILNNKLSLGTFLAVPRGSYTPDTWPGAERFLSDPPESWAVISVWNSTEVAPCEPLRFGIPHWKMLSCEEDLWCIKRLAEDYSDGAVGDWTKSPPGISIFVDPREI